MSQIVSLRPFVPSQDFELSKRFYQSLGFAVTMEQDKIAMLKIESFSFILQDYYVKDWADNCMMQLLVRDVDAWWQRIDAAKLEAEFGVKPPRPPAMQPWGLKVGFVFDPAGVLWHVAETVF
jgi:uncharacterized glyoxalase superfamily protein PhnB